MRLFNTDLVEYVDSKSGSLIVRQPAEMAEIPGISIDEAISQIKSLFE